MPKIDEAERLTERTTVRTSPLDNALISELGRTRSLDTPTLLRSVAVEQARLKLPAEVVERIERRHGVVHEPE